VSDILIEASPSQFYKLVSSSEQRGHTDVGSLLVLPYGGEFVAADTLIPGITITKNRLRASDHRVQIPVSKFQLDNEQSVYVCSQRFLEDLDKYGLAFNYTILGEFFMPDNAKPNLLFERFLSSSESETLPAQDPVTPNLYFAAPPSSSLNVRAAVRSFMVSYLSEGFNISAEDGRKRRQELERSSLISLGLQHDPVNPMEIDYLKLLK
jgi:hypothetical protein